MTATLSDAVTFSVTGPRYHGLRMPVGLAGSSAAAVIVGATVSVLCAPAGVAATPPAMTATNIATCRLDSRSIPLLLIPPGSSVRRGSFYQSLVEMDRIPSGRA